MSRGKKRIGYELEIKINFEGSGKLKGTELSIEILELCDDGSDPEFKLDIEKAKIKEKSKDKTPDHMAKLKSEIAS